MKNNLLSKSDLNLDAAELLKKNPNNHYAPSIHCAYYSCFQKLLDVIYRILDYDDSKYDRELREFKARHLGGTHDFVILTIWAKISSDDDKKDFKNDIMSLKKLRTDSDYRSDIWIEKDVSDKAHLLALSIIKNLKRNF